MTGYSNGSGSYIGQILNNTASNIETVVYHITPTANGCTGQVYDYTVTVNPKPVLTNSPALTTQCSNILTNITLTSNVSGTLFTWTCTPSSGNITGFSNNSVPASLIAQTLINTGAVLEIVTYHITPNANGCDGPNADYIVKVYPNPLLTNSPLTKSICKDESTDINLISNVSGTLFTWTCTPSSGNVTGYSNNATPKSVINQILDNTGVVPETVTYHITPEANGCYGPVTDFIVTVNPKPYLTNNPMSSTQCSGMPTNISLTASCTGTTFTWIAQLVSGNITGFSNGSGSFINQVLTNTLATAGQVRYIITPTTGPCSGNDTNYFVTVNPVPHLTNSPLNKQICNNVSTGISLTSDVTGTLFTWTATGSSPQVTGFSDNNIPTTTLNQTLVNSGYNIETVTYHITPHANGCDGSVYDYVVSVYPTPDLSNSPASKSQCTNTATNITLASNVSGTLFTWTATGSAPQVTGYTNNNTPSFTINDLIINSGYNIETVTYHITPHANGCDGVVTDYVVTIYPGANLSNSPAAKQICNNTATSITLTSNVSGTLFTWTATGSSPQVSGYINNNTPSITINDILVNSGFNVETVTYHITPSANGCSGIITDYVVTVYPVPNLSNSPASKSQCNNLSTGITLTSNVAGTQFTWTATGSTPQVSGYSNNAVPTTTLNQTLINSGFNIESVTYHITPTANGCDGVITDYVVTVYPTPNLSNSPASKSQCNNLPTGITLTSNVSGTLFTWTATGSTPQVSGFSDNSVPTTTLNQTLVNSGFNVETVTYHVTPTANGCNGAVTDYVVTVYPTPDLIE